MKQYTREIPGIWEENYRHCFKVAVLVAILLHIGLLYGVRNAETETKWTGPMTTTKPPIVIHQLPPRKPTPKPIKTTPPKVHSTRANTVAVRPIPPKPVSIRPSLTVSLPEHPEIQIENLHDMDLPEIDPPDDTVYSLHHPNIQPPQCIHRVTPHYPHRYARLGIRGATRLRCNINRNGRPENIMVVDSFNPECDAAAIDAVGQWRFTPGTFNDAPVIVTMELTICFQTN